MVISLIIGIILGGLTVLFALQNTAMITVGFLSYSFTAPLSFALLASMLGGIALTVLLLLPFVIRDEMLTRRIQREKRKLEDEYALYRAERERERIDTPIVA